MLAAMTAAPLRGFLVMSMFSAVSIIQFSSAAIADSHQRLGVNEQWQQHCHPFSSRLSLTIYRFALSYRTVVCLPVTSVYCGQTVGWTKMKLGVQVGLSPGHIALDGDPAPPPLKGTRPPVFGRCLLWPNGWMDEDATWYGSRPQPRPHCVRQGPNSLRERGTAASPSFWRMSVVATVAHLSYC